MNRSWVRFPQAAQIRPPGSGWAFLYACLLLVPRWCSGRRRARLWGRAALCARGRRPAREPSAPRASLGASPRSPARPRHRPRAPQPGPPVPPVPPHQWGRVADVWLYASPRSLARPRHRPRAPQPGSPNPQCGLACRAGILGRSAVCCYKRRQSEVFFVWISDPGYRTLRVAGGVTFWLSGAGKSVF